MSSDSGSDSDAPEDVTFSRGKSVALEVIKTVQEQVSKSKEDQREKRRQRDLKFSQQKKKKLEQLSEIKLPDEFLENIADEPLIKTASPTREQEDRLSSASLSDEDDTQPSVDDTLDDGGWGNQDDFIPLDSYGGIEIVSVREEAKKAKTSAQRAAEFKQKMLYGGSIHRETVQSKRSVIMKRKARKMKR